MSEKVKFEQRDTLKEKPEGNLGFGQYFTDYMLSVDYDEEKGGWQELKIIPYAPFEISPAAQSLHYGQAVFEGLKHINIMVRSYYSVGSKLQTYQ